jgi:WD40 repeat protein
VAGLDYVNMNKTIFGQLITHEGVFLLYKRVGVPRRIQYSIQSVNHSSKQQESRHRKRQKRKLLDCSVAMAAVSAPSRIIPSYPHAQGWTKLAYSHDGKFLITAGADQLIRKFAVDEESKEPETFEEHTEPIVAIAASRNAFASASEDCTVNLFKMQNSSDNIRLLTRCTLPVRDVAFSPDGEWLGVASEYHPS